MKIPNSADGLVYHTAVKLGRFMVVSGKDLRSVDKAAFHMYKTDLWLEQKRVVQ